jgi:hypothetical protein
MHESLLLKKKVVATSSAVTWDPAAVGSGGTLSNGNQRATFTPYGAGARGNISHTSTGKWYFEAKIIQSEGAYTPLVGICTTSTSLSIPFQNGIQEILWYGTGGQIITGANTRTPYGLTNYTTGDYIGVALNFTNNQLQFYRNGVAQGLITVSAYSAGTTFYPMCCSPYGSAGSSIVDLTTTFQYPPPSGFSAW